MHGRRLIHASSAWGVLFLHHHQCGLFNIMAIMRSRPFPRMAQPCGLQRSREIMGVLQKWATTCGVSLTRTCSLWRRIWGRICPDRWWSTGEPPTPPVREPFASQLSPPNTRRKTGVSLTMKAKVQKGRVCRGGKEMSLGSVAKSKKGRGQQKVLVEPLKIKGRYS